MTKNIVENLQFAPESCPLISVVSGTYQLKQMNEKQFIEHSEQNKLVNSLPIYKEIS